MKEEKKVEKKESVVKDLFERVETPFVPKTTNLKDIYKPMNDYVIVEVLLPEKSKGGIFLPDSVKAQEKDKVQKVIVAGPDCKIVKEGDLVLLSPMCRPMSIPLIYQENDPIQHIQVREYELMGVVDNNYQSIIKESETKSTLIN